MVGGEAKGKLKKGNEHGVMSKSRSGSRNGTVRINCPHAQNQIASYRENQEETLQANYIEMAEQTAGKSSANNKGGSMTKPYS